jgi:pyrroline-5-carboxylate reductase
MKLTVIGAGNMGGAIVEGAIRKNIVKPEDITVADVSPVFSEKLASKGIPINYVPDNAQAVKDSDLIIVAVKPWLVEKVMQEISAKLHRQTQAVVSIAAGVSFAQLNQYLSANELGQIGLYRVIPNTAIALGKSVTFVAKYQTSAVHDEQVHALFGALGKVFDIAESEMAACTALASSGIAYALRYIDASARGGEQLGLEKSTALQIVIKTVEGALALLETNGEYPQKEIDKVTTPGGITLKGLEKMESLGFSQAVIEGLSATK